MRRLRAALRDESGFAGGAEVLPFGVLVFVIGSLFLANLWAVIDAKMAVVGAAREATRAYVEAPVGDPSTSGFAAHQAAVDAGTAAFLGHRPGGATATIEPVQASFTRCSRVTYEASFDVPTIVLPGIADWGSMTVSARHSEVVDPYRSGVPGAPGATGAPC